MTNLFSLVVTDKFALVLAKLVNLKGLLKVSISQNSKRYSLSLQNHPAIGNGTGFR